MNHSASGPPSVTVTEDAGQQTVNLAGITAGSGETQPLQVTATSNNTSLIPNPTVTYTTPNATGSLAYTPVPDAFGTALVTVTVTDGGLDGNLATAGDNGIFTRTFTVTANAVNDPPTLDAIADPVAIDEDAPQQAVNLAGISAGGGESQPLQVTATSNNTGLIPNPTVTYASPNPTGSLAYTPVANQSGTAIVTVMVTDGGPDGNFGTPGDNGTFSRMFTVTVDAVNDPPTLDAIADPVAINEDAGQQTVNLTGITAGSGETQPLQVTATSNNTSLIPNPTVTYTTPNATGSLAYTPVPDAFGTAVVTVTVTDGGLDDNLATAGDNGIFTRTFTVTVNAVNDAPSFVSGGNVTVLEDAGAQSLAWATGISAGPANESGQTVSFLVSNDNNALFSAQPAVASNGVLTFTTASNANGSAIVTVTLQDSGGTLNGGVDSFGPLTFSITVNPVNDAPVAAAKSFTAQANMKVVGFTGFLSGVTDADTGTGSPACDPTPFTLDSVSGTTPAGGTVTITNASTGTVDFDPPPGVTGNVTFTYTVGDNGCPGSATSTPATVTVTVNGPVIWFVNPAAGVNGDGRLSSPFNNLASAAAVDASGHRIFLYSGTATSGISLNTDEWLIGQGVTGASFDALFGITPPTGTIARPTIGGTRPIVQGSVTMATSDAVRGLNIQPASGTQGLTANGATSLTVGEVSVTTANAAAVNLASSGGTLSFTSISANGGTNGIVLNTTTGSFTVTGGTIQNTTGDGILLTSAQGVSLSSMNVQNAGEDGIFGTTVTGLDLNGCSITGSGDDSEDVGIRVNNLLGSATWTNLTVTGSELANVFVDNTSGTLNSWTISGGTFSNLGTAFGGNSILANIRGTATLTTGSISGATFANNKPARAVTIQAQDTATISGFTVQTSTFTNNGLQASFEQSGSANLSFQLLNNPTMTMTLPAAGTSHAVNVFSSSTSTGGTIQGRIQGNTIGNAGVASSGSPIGNGIRALVQGRTVATLLIDGNVIRQVPQARGIDAQFLGPLTVQPLTQSDITVTNNDVNPQDSTGFPLAAIYAAADSQGGSPVRVRSDIRLNTVPAGVAFDVLPTFLIFDEVVAAAEAQLVDTAPVSATCTDQLTSTNTGSASGASGCALIAGPINTLHNGGSEEKRGGEYGRTVLQLCDESLGALQRPGFAPSH